MDTLYLVCNFIMKKLSLLLLLFVSCTGLFAQKKGKMKDTTIVVTEVLTVTEEVDLFDPMFPFFKEINSPHKSASEWLRYVSQKVSSPVPVYVFDFFKIGESGNFVFYFSEKRDEHSPRSVTQDTSASQFYIVPIHKFSDTSWARVHQAVISEVKAFTQTSEFKQLKLANAKAIFARYNDEVIWSKPAPTSPELKQLKDITIAAIDFYAQMDAGRMVWDRVDMALETAVREKNKAEKYFVLDDKANLQKIFTEKVKYREPNDSLNIFIRSATGYDIDVYADAKRNADLILKQNKIATKKDAEDASLAAGIYEKQAAKKDKAKSLRKLLAEYYQQWHSKKEKSAPTQSSLIKYHHKDVADIASPNGKYSVHISEGGMDKTTAQTSISLNIKNIGGSSIYYAKGTDLDIKAYWKNNNHLVIETKKSYESSPESRRHELRHYDDVVRIEIIEK
jgi:hypothetical protein